MSPQSTIGRFLQESSNGRMDQAETRRELSPMPHHGFTGLALVDSFSGNEEVPCDLQ